jgi:protein involved in polysaccharide export with SLBB domain
MRSTLAARRSGADAAGIALLAAVLLTAPGCTSGGGSSLFPNDHRLIPAAHDIAAAARPYGPIPRELQKQVLEAYYLQPGDILLLEVTDLEADIRLPVDQTIMPDGTIDLGEYGRIVVAGLTIEQVESLVLSTVQAIEKDQQVRPINVRLNVAESAVYYVLGEVNSPGSYPLIGRETVLDGLMAAGGLSDRASDCEIILSRPTPPASCRVVLPVCYDRIVQLGDTTTNYQLRPGDRIYVSTRTCAEALKFWRSDCPNCPDCGSCGCRNPLTPLDPPFVLEQYPTTASPEPIHMPGPEVVPVPIPQPPSIEPITSSASARPTSRPLVERLSETVNPFVER